MESNYDVKISKLVEKLHVSHECTVPNCDVNERLLSNNNGDTVLSKLVEMVEVSINEVKRIVKRNNDLIYSEADFERLLTNVVEYNILHSDDLRTFTIHNQVSHYEVNETDCSEKNDYRVDVLIMDKRNIEECNIHRKSFIYMSSETSPSIAFELKYFRNGDAIDTITNDLSKGQSLTDPQKAHLFVIALTDNESQVEKIKQMGKSFEDKDNLSFLVFSKEQTN